MLTHDLTATTFLCHHAFHGHVRTYASIICLFSLVCQLRESIIFNYMYCITIDIITNYSRLFTDIAQQFYF